MAFTQQQPTAAPERIRTAADAVVQALVAAGVDYAFTVPGESFLDLLDALAADGRVRIVATRHEGAAAFMAEAYAKLTGRPAVCLATRTVGATNLAIGLHTASQDSSPVIALLGQVSTARRHREAFQESELSQMFAPLVKWAVEPDDPLTLGAFTARAARMSLEGRRGPVVMSLREDLLAIPSEEEPIPPLTAGRSAPVAADVTSVLDRLAAAQRPVMLAGEDVLADGATDVLRALAERLELPVIASWRRPDVFPNEHRLFLGQAGLSAPPCVRARLLEADVILVVGARLDENTTFDYTVPAPTTHLIHVNVDAGRLLPNNRGHALVSTAREFLQAALDTVHATALDAGEIARRRSANAADRKNWEQETATRVRQVRRGYADQHAVAAHLRACLPSDTIVVSDAGNFSGWLQRYLRWSASGTFLGPVSGAMGYALPAAIAAKLARPDRPVVAIAGDGGFLMTGSELQTATRERVPVVVVVVDNGQYGTIRMHQQQHFPGRQVATDLGSTDFASYARAFDVDAYTVRHADEFRPALTKALAGGRTALVWVRADPEQISVYQHEGTHDGR